MPDETHYSVSFPWGAEVPSPDPTLPAKQFVTLCDRRVTHAELTASGATCPDCSERLSEHVSRELQLSVEDEEARQELRFAFGRADQYDRTVFKLEDGDV